ncbi:UNVERIFIED_CONTAM: hypothetical protein GTU68_046074, partial [Idotea baltica]|nr:hypothetical protein [Idotea baltica]
FFFPFSLPSPLPLITFPPPSSLLLRPSNAQTPLPPSAQIRTDDYGEFINPEDFENETLDENKENIQTQIKNFRDEEIVELEEAPTKCISQTVTVRLAAQIVFIDFEGRSDGESVLKILESIHPGRIILVRGVRTDLQAFAQNLRTITKAKVFTPKLGEIVDASLETHIYQVRLSEALVSSLLLQPASGGKEVEVAWLDGRVTYEQEKLLAMEEDVEQVMPNDIAPDKPTIPTLTQIPMEEASFHDPVFINEMRLSDFKQVLSRAGIESEFNAGILWCANGTIALRRQETGTVAIEGCLSEDYFEIKDLLYSQYAIL